MASKIHKYMLVKDCLLYAAGPNGLNNIAGPHWVTSKGLLVMVDPDTPFLHIGNVMPSNLASAVQTNIWAVGTIVGFSAQEGFVNLFK